MARTTVTKEVIAPITATGTLSARFLQDRFSDVINVKDFGAKGDGVTDDTAAIQAAINAAYTTGTLVVQFGASDYRITSTIVLGNGAEGSESTIHHGIILRGLNTPAAVGLSIIDRTGKGTRIVYDGPVSTTAAVVKLNGPILRVGVENIQLDANNKAGLGLEIVHGAHCSFRRVFTHNYTNWGFYLTTRDNVGGVVYATANNRFDECSSWFPRTGAGSGLFLGSGVPNGNNLVGPKTCTRNTFIDCVFSFDGASGTSCGIELEGATANIFINVYLNNANVGTGPSIKFTQRIPDTAFPYENIFYYVEATQNVAGTSGTYGNVLHWAWGDQQPIPSLDNVRVILSDGRKWQGVQRTREIRQTAHHAITVPVSTISTNYIDTPLSATLVCKDTNSLLILKSAGQLNKVTSGTTEAIFEVNGTQLGETIQTTNSNIGILNYAMTTRIGSVSGVNTVKVRIRSSDSNTASLVRGTILVEELY